MDSVKGLEVFIQTLPLGKLARKSSTIVFTVPSEKTHTLCYV